MPLTLDLKQTHIKSGNQGGLNIEYGEASFTTTGTSASIPTRLHTVLGVIAMPSSQPGSGEFLFWDQASGGAYKPTAGTITVKRETGTTSGLKFTYIAFGYGG
jgi:hypothetical protein